MRMVYAWPAERLIVCTVAKYAWPRGLSGFAALMVLVTSRMVPVVWALATLAHGVGAKHAQATLTATAKDRCRMGQLPAGTGMMGLSHDCTNLTVVCKSFF